MTDAPAPMELLRRLIGMGEKLTENRAVTLGSAAIRELRDQVNHHAMRPCEDERLIGAEAVCLVECMAALAYAREEKNIARETRMVTLVNALKGFMYVDLVRAEREALQ